MQGHVITQDITHTGYDGVPYRTLYVLASLVLHRAVRCLVQIEGERLGVCSANTDQPGALMRLITVVLIRRRKVRISRARFVSWDCST